MEASLGENREDSGDAAILGNLAFSLRSGQRMCFLAQFIQF
jgi:hypothetical protein